MIKIYDNAFREGHRVTLVQIEGRHERLNEKALDYAAEWWRRYEDRLVYRPQKWILHLVAKSMVRAYKKGYHAAKQKYNKPSKRKHNDQARKARPYQVVEERD